MDFLDLPKDVNIADTVIYVDEDRIPRPAIVTKLFKDKSSSIDRTICNLTIFNDKGYPHPRQRVEPAYHDGERWHVINKWAFRSELPEDEFRERDVIDREDFHKFPVATSKRMYT